MFEVEGATRAEPPAREAWWKWRGVFSCSTVLTGKGCLYSSVIVLGALIEHFSLHLFRKQCIELEQQFDFLKDLVASVPDMQGDGEDNHMDGEKGPRRGRKPGSSGRKNGGTGSKSKDKKLSGTDSEQEVSEADRTAWPHPCLPPPVPPSPLLSQGSGLPRDARRSH